MKFCGHCGTRLDVADPQPELRQLTVLFCDLVGSTELAEKLEPEDLREVTRRYHSVCADVIERHEGHIAQYLGDGILVYFGHPMAHEDDARRAVRTGLGIHAALAELDVRIQDTSAVHVRARIGIHTGPVVIGEVGSGMRRENLALGKTPNLAARVQGCAEPGAVLVSEDAHSIVAGYFDFEPLGSHELKGLSDEVALYRVVRESGDQTPLDVARRRGLTQMADRVEELDALYERWEHAMSPGVSAALVGGEAGIGKSRIVDALRERIGDQATRVLQCSSSPYYRNSALYPLISMVERELGIGPDTSPEDRLRKLQRRLERRGILSYQSLTLIAQLLSIPLPEDRPRLALPPQAQREQTLEALRSWLFTIAARGPVLWIFEDLHWTDPTTLELLGSVMASGEDLPILLVMTHRPEFEAPWQADGALTALSLDRLTSEDTTTMLSHVTRGRPLPEEVVTQLIERTEGVPLFVEEVTKAVLETGVLIESADRFELSGPLPADLIPATVQGSLTARLDRLGEAKPVAQVAATIGREFRYDVLSAVADMGAAKLRQSLNRLIETELVFRDPSAPVETYLFKHALIQDAAYQSLLKKARRELHQRIGDAFAETPDIAANKPELLAHHFAAAGQASAAVPQWLNAAQLATARAANHEVIGHCRRGLESVAGLPEEDRRTLELELVITMIPAIQNTTGWASAELQQFLDRSRELVELIGDPVQRLHMVAQSFAFHVVAGRCTEALQLARQVLAMGDASGQPALVFLGNANCCVAELYHGEIANALRSVDTGLDHLTPEDDQLVTQMVGMSGQVYPRCYRSEALWMLGYPDQAVATSKDAVRIARELGHVPSIAFAIGYSTEFYPLLRDPELVLETVEEILGIEEERRSTFWEPLVTTYQGWALATQGHHDEGIELTRRGIAAYRAAGSGITQVHMLARLAEGLIAAERWDETHDVLAEAVAVAGQTGEHYYEPELYRLGAEALVASSVSASKGRETSLAEADAKLRKALEVARGQDAKSLELRATMSLGRLQREQGDAAEASELLADVYGWFTEGFDTPDLRDAKALLGQLSS